LVTSDVDAAKSFYATLFGWDYDERPLGEGAVYTIARLHGGSVAALFTDDQPPHWNCYVTVASADEAAARAPELGGSVIAEPFDVFTAGRMAMLSDPAGATLVVWQPGENIGAARVNEPGALTWNDLVTPDPDTAMSFYGSLFGWTFEDVGGGYRVISNQGRSNGGITRMDGPASWMPYFGHADVEGLTSSIGQLGGRLFNGPMQMPQGTIAVFADPQGAVFAAWTGEYDD
jgi:predicted enzyme related to lactoylglutathione lyase